jgi:hypothetical protein
VFDHDGQVLLRDAVQLQPTWVRDDAHPAHPLKPMLSSQHGKRHVRKRLAAFAIDTVVLSLCIWVGAVICWRVMGAAITFDFLDLSAENGLVTDDTLVRVTTYVSTLISFGYFVGSWLLLSASPGQRLLGLRTWRAGTNAPLTLAQASARWVFLGAPIWVLDTTVPDELGAVFSLASVLWGVFLLTTALRSKTGQAAHDRWSGSLVVAVEPAEDRATSKLPLVKPNVG